MDTPDTKRPRTSLVFVAKATLVVAGVICLAFAALLLRHVILLFFAAIVLAVIVQSGATLVQRVVPLGRKPSVGIACVLIALILAGAVMLMGAQVSAQMSALWDAVPQIRTLAQERFGVDLGVLVNEIVDISWLTGAIGYVPGVFGVVSGLILVIAGGIFLALDPEGYREGVLLLVPQAHRDRMRITVNRAASSLQRWLIGQMILMVVVGASTAAVLALLGVPSALALGLIVGLLEFIPYVGPILGYVPLGLAALSQSFETFWWVLAAYVLIQQVEGNALAPLIQKRTVELPPVVALFSIVALGLLFGPLGIILSVPLTVVLLVLVNDLYLEDVLHNDEEAKPPPGVPADAPASAADRLR
jgi:predicted PurR-regulated permease PerM